MVVDVSIANIPNAHVNPRTGKIAQRAFALDLKWRKGHEQNS